MRRSVPSSRPAFTLVELLVVIAIIGILSAVVLANLNSARQKGTDASVKSNLSNLRSQMELPAAGASSFGFWMRKPRASFQTPSPKRSNCI